MIKENEIEKVVNDIILWVKSYVEKSGAKGIILGNSGGKDSATVLAISAKAIESEHILAIAMPCSSKTEDLKDAKLVAETFGVKMLEVNLSEVYEILERDIEKVTTKDLSNESKINMKPRLRMTTLYAIAQTLGYLVIGTGNASERYVGYTTKWGDNACDFNPIANFTAEEIIQIGKYLGVPESIIYKAPNDGLGSGTDEEKMGVTYKQISEYMQTGKTEENASIIIEKLHKKSEHKRKPIPIYEK